MPRRNGKPRAWDDGRWRTRRWKKRRGNIKEAAKARKDK